MNTPCVLGIDTSAYTTSLAVVSATGKLLVDKRIVLTVPARQRGLRQSDALYQHVKNLPLIYESTFLSFATKAISTVCVSTMPRPAVGSYMPVFIAGAGMARCTAAALGVPLLEASHQEGHLWAALWSLPSGSTATLQAAESFLALHLSGGTTEALLVQAGENDAQQRLRLELVGGTQDISAGQFVDRVGVALGLPFPAGPHLEDLATQGSTQALRLPVAVSGSQVSFSGPESAAQRAIAAGVPGADVARATYVCIADTLARWISSLMRTTPVDAVVLSGGVVASQLLRTYLQSKRHLQNMDLVFAGPEYSSDNAVGLAAWGAARTAGIPLLSLPERGVST